MLLLRSLLRSLARWWDDPLAPLLRLGPSEPYLCHACGSVLGPRVRVLFSERYGGPVDPDCPQIPMWIRHQSASLRLIWLRSSDQDRTRHALPEAFCLETALRGLRRAVPAGEG